MTPSPRLPAFYSLRRFERLGSTSEEAKRLAADGAPGGLVIWAREQTAGHGRRGRPWVSPPGNLYVSVVLRPDCVAPAAAQLGFAAALAIGEATLRWLPPVVALSYKWPNDVLLDGRKLSGILLESQAAADGRLAWLVLGIGINLAAFPETVEYPATSLAAAGAGTIAPELMLEALAERFLHWYERWRVAGFAPLRQAWLARVHGLGTPIRVRLQREEMDGRFVGLDEDGVLLLETPAGCRRVAAGDVFPAGP
jgi:BirA family biotin operon repressor/biotin-[acetyl-CoA-carboxylase] ligase